MALKRLSRKLDQDLQSDPASLETIAPDNAKPRCPSSSCEADMACSVSHDSRFVFAAAANGSIGVDVETVSEKLSRGARLYMSEAESRMADSSPLGRLHAEARIWTIKEAAAKALGITLPRAWREVEVAQAGADESRAIISGRQVAAIHVTVDDHLFTLLTLPD